VDVDVDLHLAVDLVLNANVDTVVSEHDSD